VAYPEPVADTSTLPGVDRRPLISYLRIQADFETQMLAILQSASVSIDAELARLVTRSGVGAGIRLEQLAQTQAAIHRQTSQLFSRLGNTLEASRADAAAAAVETMHPAKLLGEVFPKADRDYMLRSAQATAKRGIELAEARMNLSQLPLSARVYETERLVDGTIDRIINDAITRGASAAELAKDVMGYIRPDTPGGVKYAAQRLGRTELNNAFHATQVQEAINSPWVTALKWNLSGSHPKPDECNTYAERNGGLWKPEEVPAKPHPNCLCFTTPVTPEPDEFVQKYKAGQYDEVLDETYPGLQTQSPAKTFGENALSGHDAQTEYLKNYPPQLRSAEAIERAAEAVQTLHAGGTLSAEETALAGWRRYTGHGYTHMNRALRTGEGMDEQGKWIDALDSYIDGPLASKMGQDTVLERGVIPWEGFNPTELKAGELLTERGYMSTAMNSHTARDFAIGEVSMAGAGEDWVFQILVPKGTPYAAGTIFENEVILGRGTISRIVSVNAETRTIQMELIPGG
jgi:hypothetical protein